MEQLKSLNDRIVNRVNISLQEFDFNADAFVAKAMNHDKMLKFYAFYGITSQHPIHFNFSNSNISGSYFLGKCSVGRSAIYKSDIRGDELKRHRTIKLFHLIQFNHIEQALIKESIHQSKLNHKKINNWGSGFLKDVGMYANHIGGFELRSYFMLYF